MKINNNLSVGILLNYVSISIVEPTWAAIFPFPIPKSWRTSSTYHINQSFRSSNKNNGIITPIHYHLEKFCWSTGYNVHPSTLSIIWGIDLSLPSYVVGHFFSVSSIWSSSYSRYCCYCLRILSRISVDSFQSSVKCSLSAMQMYSLQQKLQALRWSSTERWRWIPSCFCALNWRICCEWPDQKAIEGEL